MADQDLQVEAPEDNQRPEWLPENFETPEALATSYKEAQRKITEEAQARKQLEQQVEWYEEQLAQSRQQPTQQQYDPSADPLITTFEQAMEAGDFRTALAVQAQIATAIAEQRVSSHLPQMTQQNEAMQEAQAALVADHAWNSLTSRHSDIENFRDQITEQIQAQPWLIPDDAQRDPTVAARAIENVYRIVNPAAFVQGAPDTTAQKLAAQSLPGAAGRTPAQQVDEWAAVKEAAKKEPGRYW